jgi:small redox-active disulfide protein 2
MTSTEVTQIMVSGHLTGIIDLKTIIKDVAGEFSGRSDDEIADELMVRLSKKNYIVPRVKEDYKIAFLREYKKFVGEPFEEAADPGLVQVKVLGPGCPNCQRLEQDLMNLMAELKIQADLEHVRDPLEIGSYGVIAMPAVVINGKVMAAGRVPSKGTLKEWLLEAQGL